MLQNLADRTLKTRYVVATDTSKDSLIRLTRKVSQMLGTGKVKVVDQEDAMLNRDITVNTIPCSLSAQFRSSSLSASRLRHATGQSSIRTGVHSRTDEY